MGREVSEQDRKGEDGLADRGEERQEMESRSENGVGREASIKREEDPASMLSMGMPGRATPGHGLLQSSYLGLTALVASPNPTIPANCQGFAKTAKTVPPRLAGICQEIQEDAKPAKNAKTCQERRATPSHAVKWTECTEWPTTARN